MGFYRHYKWPDIWVTGLITALLNGTGGFLRCAKLPSRHQLGIIYLHELLFFR